MLTNKAFAYMDEPSIYPLLKCKLCTKPFVDPVSTPTGETFCRPCISQILLRDVSDESIKSSLNNDQHTSKLQSLKPVTEKLVIDLLDSLLVRCLDCEQINIPRGQLDKHKSESCIQATVLCPAADIKCHWIGTRQELDEHLDQCNFQPLRSAFNDIFDEHHEFKNRIFNLQTQIDVLMNENDFKTDIHF
jgi:hypothetical protein